MKGHSDPPVAAWRCEECRAWRPRVEAVHALVVLDIGPDSDMSDHLERAYVPRVLHVCGACRAAITGDDMGFENPKQATP
jgi:hypothetical protein